MLSLQTDGPAAADTQDEVVVRAFDDHLGDWEQAMRAVAPLLSKNYPGGGLWLGDRLHDVSEGRAFAHLAVCEARVCGIAVESPKAPGEVKLSTLWVASDVRGRRIGSRLLLRCLTRWQTAAVRKAWVTANDDVIDSISGLVLPVGFQVTAIERDRYGAGRDEWVLHWTPERHAAMNTQRQPLDWLPPGIRHC